MVVKDAKDAVAGAPDLTRAQLGLASDRRVRIALTLAAPWQPKDLIARRGAAGLAVRAPVDGDQARRHAARLPRLRDDAAPTARPCAAPCSRPQPGEEMARAGAGDRRAHQRPHDDPALLADARRTAQDDRLHRRGHQARLHARVVRRHGARSAQDRHLPRPRKLLGKPREGETPASRACSMALMSRLPLRRGRRRCLRGARATRLRLR